MIVSCHVTSCDPTDQAIQPDIDPTAITLAPMVIRTLICEIAYMQ